MKKKSVEFKLKAEKQAFPIEQILTSMHIYNYSKKFYLDDINIYESVFVILMNRRLNTIGFAKISQGGVDKAVVDNRIIAKYAIDSLASNVILVHNHPSGNIRPSREDDQVTESVQKSLALFGIKLVDSLIISEGVYYSYSDEGRL